LTVTVPRRFRFAPILTATVLTVLLLYLFGKTASIFLLLFIAALLSLYLGAVAEVFQHRLRLPPRVALGAAIALTLAAIITLFRLLVPPVVEQKEISIVIIEHSVYALPVHAVCRICPIFHKGISRSIFQNITFVCIVGTIVMIIPNCIMRHCFQKFLQHGLSSFMRRPVHQSPLTCIIGITRVPVVAEP
jgi:hypothetical protein